MKGEWLNAFRAKGAIEFTEENYAAFKAASDSLMPFYLKYLPAGSSLLECCCGPGCTAIPLSHHYKVTAFDRDERVLSHAMANAARFGKDIKILAADFWDVDRMFSGCGFDACGTSGVLEYYPEPEVRELVGKQLITAPLVFIDVSTGGGKPAEDEHGITDYNHTRDKWLGGMLEGRNIEEWRAYGVPEGERLLLAVKR